MFQFRSDSFGFRMEADKICIFQIPHIPNWFSFSLLTVLFNLHDRVHIRDSIRLFGLIID